MAWAYFQNQAAYDAYHNAVCADQGIPRPGRLQSTQEPAVMTQWTDAWADPIQLRSQGNVTTWATQIPDAHVVQYDPVLGITLTDSQVVFNRGPDGIANGTVTVKHLTAQTQTTYDQAAAGAAILEGLKDRG